MSGRRAGAFPSTAAAVAVAVIAAACGGRALAPPSNAPPPSPGGPATSGHAWRIDTQKSRVRVDVKSAGLLGHDHWFTPQTWGGTLRFDPKEPSAVGFDLVFAADALRDDQPAIKESDRRSEIEPTARGPAVLDATRYPSIRFVGGRLTSITAGADGSSARGTLVGTLVLRGRQREIAMPIQTDWTASSLHAKGEGAFLQTDFGISPLRRMLGLVALDDTVKVSFDLVAALESTPEASP